MHLQGHAGTYSEVSSSILGSPSASLSLTLHITPYLSRRAQNRLALNAKLKGQSLGAASTDDPDSALSFVKKLKKSKKLKEFELARKREQELAEREKDVYGEEDLRGLKVAHDADDFVEGEDVILTLKDNRILDGEGESNFPNLSLSLSLYYHSYSSPHIPLKITEDELQNVNLADDEAVKASKDRKRKAKAAYTGYDDEEFDPDRVGAKADVLGKYDDEYMGSGKRDVSL